MKRFIPLVFLLLFAPTMARADKNNVGTRLPSLSVSYVSNPPTATVGKPMIVEFWATWCPPCRQTIPHLNEIYKTYKDRGLVVVGISTEAKNTVTEFMKALPMNYSVALDTGGSYSRQFGFSGIPHAFLVNTAGNIVWEGHPMSLTPVDIEGILSGAASTAPAPAPSSPGAMPPLPGGNKHYY